VTQVFKLENLYDGLAIGGGMVSALGLPSIIDRFIPATIKTKLPFSITSGWMGYVANAACAGLSGYLVGTFLGRKRGEQVFLGGIGATVAKLLLDKVPAFGKWTGVSTFGQYNNDLQRVVEQEVAAELAAGGMSAYATPSQMLTAPALGDYATPADMLQATSLGVYPGGEGEFGEGTDFDA
jgi:hypothetical protein